MSTIISTDAKVAQASVKQSSAEIGFSVSNLVSGTRTDANVADFSVGSILTSKVGVLRTAILNAGQAKSLLETAKGALKAISELLNQQKNLAVKSADDSLSNNERGFLNQEFQALTSEIDRISNNTNFNGKKLIDGSISGNAGTATATGLSTENYSLIQARSITSSGTVASGSLVNTHAIVGENLITFGAETGGTAGTVTITLDEDGSSGSTTAQTITFDVAASATAATNAAAFVAAATASTAGENFQQFEYIDHGDGNVTIRALEAGDHLNNYAWSGADGTAAITILWGNDGSQVNADTGDGGTARLFNSENTTATTGTAGIFKSVAANNIADTRFSGDITFADTTAISGNVNGIKTVRSVEFTGVFAATDVFTFGDITLTASGTPATFNAAALGNQVEVADDVQDSAAILAGYLNLLSQAGTGDAALFNFTVVDDTILATAKNFASTINTEQADVAISITQNASVAITLDDVADGRVAGVASVAATSNLTIRDGSNTIVADVDITIAANTTTAVYTGTQIATIVADFLNSNNNQAARLFSFTDNADGSITFASRTANLDHNTYDINFTDENIAYAAASGVTSGGVNIRDAVAEFNAGTNTLAVGKNIDPADLTFDNRLQGEISNLQGTFNYNVDGNGNNTVVFTAEVNGVQYTSQVVYLASADADDQGVGNTADNILGGTVLTFQSSSGPRNTAGAFTNSGFQLEFTSTDVALASVTNAVTGQNSLNTVVSNLQTQLDTVSINQNRSFNLTQINPSDSDHRITAAVGTILEGLSGFDSTGTNRLSYANGDIRLISDGYGDTGTHGDITSFTVDRLTDTISTSIGGETFTAYLNSGNAPTSGGVVAFQTDLDGGTNNGVYNSTTKIITLGSSQGETAKLNFFSADVNDGRVLQIDLGNVAANISQINISTAEGEAALEAALNAVFNVSSNDSLSFQVGSDSSDSIGVSIGSARTTSLYLDDDGVAQVIGIATISEAQAASDILDTAINNVISLIADVDAAITSFDSAILNNESSVQNADAARSVLLDTDYSQESTKFAEARVRTDAAVAVLAQINQRIQNLLALVQN